MADEFRLTLGALNGMRRRDVAAAMLRCCGSPAWAIAMAASRPLPTLVDVHHAADNCFDALVRDDWLDAFADHPKIGDLKSLRMKYAGNRQWSGGEQAGVSGADDATLNRMAMDNAEYERKFGHIFIVCATGKSAAQMLALLEERLGHTQRQELEIASAEQRKITHLRLDKMLA